MKTRLITIFLTLAALASAFAPVASAGMAGRWG
jgi:hypothetical protein